MPHSLERNLLALFQHLFSVNASHLMPQHLCSSRSPLSCDTFDSIDISYLTPRRGTLLLCHVAQEFAANWLTFNRCRCYSLSLLVLCPTSGHLLMTFGALTFRKCSVLFCITVRNVTDEIKQSRATSSPFSTVYISACWPDSADVGFCSIVYFNGALLFYTDKELVPQ